MGLMDYKARFYSPTLMRFTQPDTIVPEPGNPQSFNRYSYGLNNPVKYVDTTGHKAICIDEQCFDTTPGSYIHYSKSVARPPTREYGLFNKQTNQPKKDPKGPQRCNPSNPYACGEGGWEPEPAECTPATSYACDLDRDLVPQRSLGCSAANPYACGQGGWVGGPGEGFGFRVEASGMIGLGRKLSVGVDVNLDLIYLYNMGAWDLTLGIGPQSGTGGGAGVSSGLLFIQGTPDSSTYAGGDISIVGVSVPVVILPVNLEVDQSESSSGSSVTYVGIGTRSEGSIYYNKPTWTFTGQDLRDLFYP
jgi:hypothetical protein